VYLTDPSINLYSRKDAATVEDISIPPDSIEFGRLSMYLIQGPYDLTQLARTSGSSSTSSKRGSITSLTGIGSSKDNSSVKPKRFLKVVASTPDMKTEAITLQRRQKPDQYLLSSVTREPMKVFSEYHQNDDPSSGPTSSTHSSSSFGDERASSDSSVPGGPKFVTNSFEKAPFSSLASRFEGELQVPTAMDDQTFDAFRSHVMATSDLAVTVTVHELEVELEKREADLIQELVDTLSAKDDASSANPSSSSSQNQVTELRHPMTGIMSPFSLDLRVDFATFHLGVETCEYKFSNVESLRVLQVSQYLRAKKNFLVVQVGSLRLPSADPIPSAPPTLAKIPEFNDYERSNVLTVIMVNETLEVANTASQSYASSASSRAHSSHSTPPTNSRMTLVIETEILSLDHRLGAKWIGDLSGFFVRDIPPDLTAPKTEVQLFVNAKNSAASLRGNILSNKEVAAQSQQSNDPILLLHFDKLTVRSEFLIPTDPAKNNLMEFYFRTTKVQAFLIDDKGRVWLKPYENATIKTMRQYWLARGYSPAGYIESLFAKISLNSLALPSFTLDLNMSANLDTTGDQVFTITQLLTSLATPSPPSPTLSGSSSSSSLAPPSISSPALVSSSKPTQNKEGTGSKLRVETEYEQILTPAFAQKQSDLSQSRDDEEQYVLVKLTPAEMKQRQAELKQEELLRAFKMAKRAPTQGPQVRFFHPDSSPSGRYMPRPIENYRPKPVEAAPVQHSFKFNFSSDSFVWRLREGISLTDEQQGAKYGEYNDILSNNPSKHVDVNLRGLKVSFTSDEIDQTDLNIRVQRFFFTSAMDPSGSKPFIDLDRGALSVAPHMLSLQLSSMYNLQEDSPGLHASPRRPPSNPSSPSVSNQTTLASSSGGSVANQKLGNSTNAGSSAAPPNAAKDDQLSSILIFSILPLTIRVDIEALDFMRSFYTTFTASKPPALSSSAGPSPSPSSSSQQQTSKSKPGPHFHRVSISAVSLNLNVSAWAVRLDDAVIRLPSLYSRGVEGWEGVSAELSAVYSPLLYSSLFTFAGSLPVVRLALSVLGSVSNLVINPYAEYQQGRSAAAGAYGALTVGATSVATELLKFGAWVTSSAGDGLQYLESFWHTPEASRTQAPANVQQGAQQGYASVARQVAAARDCLVVMPWKDYKKHQSLVGLVAGVAGAVPLAILKPVIGATHGLSDVMQGASNAIHIPGRTKDHIPAAHLPPRTSAAPSTSPSRISASPSRK
jgi:hypothetical protein